VISDFLKCQALRISIAGLCFFSDFGKVQLNDLTCEDYNVLERKQRSMILSDILSSNSLKCVRTGQKA